MLTHELAHTKGIGKISVGIEQFGKRDDNILIKMYLIGDTSAKAFPVSAALILKLMDLPYGNSYWARGIRSCLPPLSFVS